MPAGFDHATISVTDLDSAIEFFSLLGFEKTAAVVVSGEVMSTYMGIGDWEADHITLVLRDAPSHQEIQLLRFINPPVRRDEGSGDLARTGFNHICFSVDNLDDVLDRLAKANVNPLNKVMHFHDRRLVFLAGPEGVVVELADWTQARDSDARS